MQIDWIAALLDRPASTIDESAAFWAAITGSTLGDRKGEHGEYVSFQPDDGADAHLRMQRIESGEPACHLGLHVADIAAAAAEAEALGGAVLAHHGWFAVVATPGGQPLCLVPPRGQQRRQAPIADSAGRRTLLDQISIDADPDVFEEEVRFWSAITGTSARSARRQEFAVLGRPSGSPWRLLLHRRNDPEGRTRLHLDFACDDVGAAVAAHRARGATRHSVFEFWTVMSDPTGWPYCLTARNPATGTHDGAGRRRGR